MQEDLSKAAGVEPQSEAKREASNRRKLAALQAAYVAIEPLAGGERESAALVRLEACS